MDEVNWKQWCAKNGVSWRIYVTSVWWHGVGESVGLAEILDDFFEIVLKKKHRGNKSVAEPQQTKVFFIFLSSNSLSQLDYYKIILIIECYV